MKNNELFSLSLSFSLFLGLTTTLSDERDLVIVRNYLSCSFLGIHNDPQECSCVPYFFFFFVLLLTYAREKKTTKQKKRKRRRKTTAITFTNE